MGIKTRKQTGKRRPRILYLKGNPDLLPQLFLPHSASPAVRLITCPRIRGSLVGCWLQAKALQPALSLSTFILPRESAFNNRLQYPFRLHYASAVGLIHHGGSHVPLCMLDAHVSVVGVG
jgi:hypothetical protein